jgi:hypothetical protein
LSEQGSDQSGIMRDGEALPKPFAFATAATNEVPATAPLSVAVIRAGIGAYQTTLTSISMANALTLLRSHDAMMAALKDCDNAFAAWQIGQIPGRPEDILALITKVRSAIANAEGGH